MTVAMRLDSIIRIEFIWYWLDEKGRWIEYGKRGSEHSAAATITSFELETAFLADHRGVVFFRAGTQLYELSFQEMVQRNVYYQTKRRVSRWPRIIFFGGGQECDKGHHFESSLPVHVFPSSWDQSALPNLGYKLVTVSKTTGEYHEIKELFENTMEGYIINRLQRIQNPSLWQREQMKKLSGGKEVDERLLFHGTSTSHLHDICAQNFDWRICGTHGTLYGKGSYFARDANYSHTYCCSKTRAKTMIVARVLVGDYVPGNSTYLRPPSRPKQSDCFYDSCVDSLLNPSIFVIFEKHQIYPAYIIEYEQVSHCVVM
ncbi:protein mono-ADP-ribosyltransferase PARP12-like isoform X2 [Sceloporus undulatus]|uniref:protein mono-ADP-ribosyltransferase PARP12-like isoform X2 n=1 Tax=Sceloporus undulatus TaxID=8520 RepID=UPI001C4DA7E7|nr:protein mono-ADP-ribosyltransferase PARP12-like isoform X2 [Sceloporus undulatus]